MFEFDMTLDKDKRIYRSGTLPDVIFICNNKGLSVKISPFPFSLIAIYSLPLLNGIAL